MAEYIRTGSKTQAMRAGGYAETTATHRCTSFFERPAIRMATEYAMSEAAKALGITVETVLDDVRRRGNLAEEAEDYSAALASSRLLGQHLRMWGDEQSQGATINIISDRPVITSAEWERECQQAPESSGLLNPGHKPP